MSGARHDSQLGPPRDRATLLALAVLHEAIIECGAYGAIALPALGVRLALAHLHEAAGEADRAPLDELWRTLTARDEVGRDQFRPTWAGTQFAMICRRVGVAQDIELTDELARLGGRESAAAAAFRRHRAGTARVSAALSDDGTEVK